MKTCQKCSKQNRAEAKYCRYCGAELIAASSSAGNANLGITSSPDGLLAKDSIKDSLKKFGVRCASTKEFMRITGTSMRQFDCLIIGDAGTGKRYMADHLCGLLYKHKLSKNPKPTIVDAADWSEYLEKLDENLNSIKDSVLHITNCQNIVNDDGAGELDKLFARMRNNPDNLPIIMLSGLKEGFGDFIEKNQNVSAVFEFTFHLNAFTDKELSSLCYDFIEKKFKMKISPEGKKQIYLVLKQKFREGSSAENGALSWKFAGECAFNSIERGGAQIEEQDVKGKAFEELTEDQILAKLDGFVGLTEVKQEIHNVIASIKKQKKDNPGKPVKLRTHYVFTGNPGTGKTTIARLFADVLNCLEVLPSGQLVEVTRKDLVSQYVGDTAIKTEKVIEKAMGGILFIDEAYSLMQGANDNYGNECITELLKLLEDRRGRFVCIAAGYTREMSQFMNSNSGLPSRFNKTIEFEDYNAEDMLKIFDLNCRKEGYSVEAEAAKLIAIKFQDIYANRSYDFGNARDVRNVFRVIKSATARRANAEMSELIRQGIDKVEAYQRVQPKLIKKEDVQ